MATVTLDTTFTSYFIPFSVIAEWPTANYVNPETRSWLVPYAILLQLLSTFCVCGRVYAKWLLKQWGLEDVLILFAWIFGTLFTALGIYGVKEAGLNLHIWDLPPPLVIKSGLVGFLSEAAFFLSSSMTKLSFLLFQRRLISRTINPRIRQAINAAIAFTIVYTLTFLLFLPLACNPVDSAWKSLDPGYTQPYKCAHRNIVDPLVGALSVFSDIYALIIPEIIILGLQIRKQQKVNLCAVFGSGLIAAGAGLARTVWLARLYTDSRRDITWIGYEIVAWTELEMQLAIVCASAPALKSLARNVNNGITRTRGSAYGKSGNNSMKGFERSRSFETEATENASFEEYEASPQKGILVTETLSIQSTWYRQGSSPRQSDKGRRVLGLSV